MYHIKDTKRSRFNAEELGKGLILCLQTKPLNQVSISDLHRVTGISRSTIYRLFDTPEDVLYYLCAQYMEQMADYFNNHTFSNIRELSVASIKLSIEKNELLEILVNNNRLDLLTEIYAANFQHILSRIPAAQMKDEVTNEYLYSFLYMTMSAVQTTWVKRGKTENSEQLFEYLKEYGTMLAHLFDAEIQEKL